MYPYFNQPYGGYPYPPMPPAKAKKKRPRPLSVEEIQTISDGWTQFLESVKKEDEGKKKRAPSFNLWDTMFLLTVFALPLAALEIASVKIAMQIAKEMLK